MKRKFTVLTALVLCLALCLSACGLKPIEEEPTKPSETPSAAPSAAPAPSETPQEPEKEPEPVSSEEPVTHKTTAASGTDIPVVTIPDPAASETDIPKTPTASASSSDVGSENSGYTVGLGSDNRYYAQNDPQIVQGQLVFFIEEAFWEDAGLTIACTILNGTDKDIAEPNVKRFEVSNAETAIADVRMGVLEGCRVAKGGSEYWEFFIPKNIIAAPYALLNTLMITVTTE